MQSSVYDTRESYSVFEPHASAASFALLDAGTEIVADTGGIRAGMTVAQAERDLIYVTLEACNNNKTQAATMLDISVRTLRNKLKEYEEG